MNDFTAGFEGMEGPVDFFEMIGQSQLNTYEKEGPGYIAGSAAFEGVTAAVPVSKIAAAIKAVRLARLADKGSDLARGVGKLSNVEARQWYLNQEAQIKNMIDTAKPLEQQARQAFDLRTQFRIQARELMSDRSLAEALYKTDPNITWEQIVEKYTNKGFSGDSLWQEIIDASTRSRTSVNQKLGLR